MQRVQRIFDQIQQSAVLLAIQEGMMLSVPVIFIGSIALLLMSFPLPQYQTFLHTAQGEAFSAFLSLLQRGTLGIISGVILLSISFRYETIKETRYRGITPIISLAGYVVLTADTDVPFSFAIFQGAWLGYAILTASATASAFHFLYGRAEKISQNYSLGDNVVFRHAILTVLPSAVILILFGLGNRLLNQMVGDGGLLVLFSDAALLFFKSLGRTLISGFLFLLLMHLMWFFGIHGSNVLDHAARNIFEQGIAINIQNIHLGQAPTELVSKAFLDTFVLFGGCGTLLCLLTAIFLAEKRDAVRQLSKIALLPAIFNMNELLVFGVPIVLNPIYFIPFLLTPIVLFLVSYAAVVTGLVPYTTHAVEWTTPIFLSGYMATGSIAGCILQGLNLALGTAIYLPFVYKAQKKEQKKLQRQLQILENLVKENEKTGIKTPILSREDSIGLFAKNLVKQLSLAIESEQIQLYYQPQANAAGKILGAEALLRWRHETLGFFYPPLMIRLAEEGGLMPQLGSFIIKRACDDMDALLEEGIPLEISINLTGAQFSNMEVLQEISAQIALHKFSPAQLGLELTEQTAVYLSGEADAYLTRLSRQGVKLILDDFGMGHNSILYLQNNDFDIVKLDGSLIRELLQNSRSADIISSILYLAGALKFQVIAEGVETKEQRDKLLALGCSIYQGYYYSRPLPYDEFLSYLKNADRTEGIK